MDINKFGIFLLFIIACCITSCDSAVDPVNDPDEFAKLTILPAPGYYPIGSTLTMSFTGIEIDTVKYVYRWTLNDTITVDSLRFSHTFESSGRYEATLRIYTKKDSKLTAKASSVLIITQNYLSIDTLKTFTKFKVEFGGFGRLEVRKDTVVTYLDTIFSLGNTEFSNIALWSESTFLSNEVNSSFLQTRFTQSEGSHSVTCQAGFDSLLQVLIIDSLYLDANSGRWESYSNGILTGSGGYCFIIKFISFLISKESPTEVVFEMPEKDIPLAIKHIVYGSGINSSFNGYDSGWGSTQYKVLTSIDGTNSIKPYLRLIFKK